MVGFDARNKNIVDVKYICPKCLLILRAPVQLSDCGHRQCQSCIDDQHRTTIIYPRCQTETASHEVVIDRGFIRDMQSLPIDCSFCQSSDILDNYQEHLDQSHTTPICEYCDEQFNSVNELNDHKVLRCEKVTIYCLLKDFGCNEPVTRGKMKEHYLTQQHQEAAMKVVRQMRSQLVDIQMDTDVPQRTTTVAATMPPRTQLQEIDEILNILSGGIEALNDDGQRLSSESVEALSEDISPVKLSEEELVIFGDGVKQNQDLSSVKEKMNDMKYVSYDGTYVWKIKNFKEKMADAQSERQTLIHSPPFYSSPTGYKMCLRLYLYGDGNARRTHISLFFVLMRGVNDAILKFPFNSKVTFCLYDQTAEQNHIIDSFRPDIRSNSFQQPRSNMNTASGIPKFFPLAMIQQEGNSYVRDDTMFIKVMIDFSDMPETLLPYALSLNPGLPTYVQQAMIKQEAKRRAQQEFELVAQGENERIGEEEVGYQRD